VQAKAQRIRRYEKRKPSISSIRCSKRHQKTLQELGHEGYRGQRTPPSMAEVELYWESLWGDKAQHNGRAE